MGRKKKIVVEEVKVEVPEVKEEVIVQQGDNITFNIDPRHELHILPSLND